MGRLLEATARTVTTKDATSQAYFRRLTAIRVLMLLTA